jgi:tRNA G18 (ribose-2'-O)-methylase SpoU
MTTHTVSLATAETRAWRLAADQLRRIDTSWDDPVARLREILACKRWMERQNHLPRLARLAGLLDPAMTRKQFWAVLVPAERAGARTRVTDLDILARDPPPDAAQADRMPLTVVADNIRSAFNLGGIFRTAECLGAAAVWLCGYSADPGHPQVAAAALGTVGAVPWRSFERIGPALAELREAGVWTVALETVAGAPEVGALSWRFPSAIVIGNERFGLDPETVAACDTAARIPSYGVKNSLNVVTALAICAWDARLAFQRSTLNG